MKNEPQLSSFPSKTFFGSPKGWQDLGAIKNEVSEGKNCYPIHVLCNTRLNIGKENGNLFRFCPMCLIKTR